jgi:hypothetical protein
MKIGFTGTREGLSLTQRFALRATLTLLTPQGANEFHYGTHKNVPLLADDEAADIADVFGYALKPHEASSGTELRRNAEIVGAVELLVAAPLTNAEQLRSGTWATVRYARKRGIPIVMLPR